MSAYKKLQEKQQFGIFLDYFRKKFDFESILATDEGFMKYDVATVFTVRGKCCFALLSRS